MNLRILVLKKTDKLSAFLRLGSIFFRPMIVDGKNKFLEKLWFVLRKGIFSAFGVEYNVRWMGNQI